MGLFLRFTSAAGHAQAVILQPSVRASCCRSLKNVGLLTFISGKASLKRRTSALRLGASLQAHPTARQCPVAYKGSSVIIKIRVFAHGNPSGRW